MMQRVTTNWPLVVTELIALALAAAVGFAALYGLVRFIKWAWHRGDRREE
jgi:uncharacterized membrane protein SpoIIM required for sporulation